MIHLVNLARFEELKGNKAQALSYLEEMEKISKKYETWPDTKELLSKAAKIQGRL